MQHLSSSYPLLLIPISCPAFSLCKHFQSTFSHRDANWITEAMQLEKLKFFCVGE